MNFIGDLVAYIAHYPNDVVTYNVTEQFGT